VALLILVTAGRLVKPHAVVLMMLKVAALAAAVL
jgi:hypothetical protein